MYCQTHDRNLLYPSYYCNSVAQCELLRYAVAIVIIGRALDWGSKGCWFKSRQWSNCVVSFSKILYPVLSTGSTWEELFRHDWKFVDWDVKNQNKTKTTLQQYQMISVAVPSKDVCQKLTHLIRMVEHSIFVSPMKHDRQIGIMTPVSSLSALSHFWFPIDNSWRDE